MGLFIRKPKDSNVFRSSEKTGRRKYPGNMFLELALHNALLRLGDTNIDNMYRASLVGGNVGAALMLAYDERCFKKWGEGDVTKAARLIQVWASTAILIFLQKEEDQESVRNCTAKHFSWFFDFNEEELENEEKLEAELLAYQRARKSENEMLRRKEEGFRNFSNQILYLRTLRALGDEGVPSLKLLPVPWGKLREMEKANPRLWEILDINILQNIESQLLIQDVLISTLNTTKDFLDKNP